MSYVEDEIRGALRSEADRLREVRPLRLLPAPAQDQLRAVHRPSLARRLSAWRGPLAAVAAVVLIAVVLVALRSLWKEQPAPAAPPPKPVAGPPLPAGATPRYYVRLGWSPKGTPLRWGIVVGDEQTGRTLGTYPITGGNSFTSIGLSGAGDDRTFVVSIAAITAGLPRATAPRPTWYLVRVFPGSASPVRVTRLAVNFKASGEVREIALSADGTELAVVSGTSQSTVLGVYSVVTGQLRNSWSTPLGASASNFKPVSDLSWVGDGTVGFAVTYTPRMREEVRTLDTGAGGTSLLAASRVVWSQDVSAPPPGSNPYHAPQACSTPFLTGDGTAVVCATSSYSARDNRLTALWLAYPLATPTRPRVIGSVVQPTDVNKFDSVTVEWSNPSGTEIIGAWNPNVDSVDHGAKVQTVTNFTGFIGHGKVRPFGPVFGLNVTW